MGLNGRAAPSGRTRVGTGHGWQRGAATLTKKVPDRVGQSFVGRALVQEVVRAGRKRPLFGDVARQHRQSDNHGVGTRGPDPGEGVEATHDRHEEVQQDDLGAKSDGLLDGLQAVPGLPHHLEPARASQEDLVQFA